MSDNWIDVGGIDDIPQLGSRVVINLAREITRAIAATPR